MPYGSIQPQLESSRGKLFSRIRQSMKTLALSALVVCLVAINACRDTQDDATPDVPATALTAHATQRAAFEIVGADTLSDSARIIRVLPESDGDGIIATFADPARRVSAGLAIVDRRMEHPQLLWPDSVTSAWWTGPHTVAFTTTTGDGIRLVVDIHAATLKIADTTATGVQGRPVEITADASLTQRARAYIDSVHLQPAGTSPTSMLTFAVTRVIPSPDGSLAAFHATARDPSGSLTNPAWYVIDRSSGAVTPLDRITGAAGELPQDSGAWSSNSSFFYAKGRSIWEAEIQRSTSSAVGS